MPCSSSATGLEKRRQVAALVRSSLAHLLLQTKRSSFNWAWRGLITQTDTAMPVEWLHQHELKSIRIDERFILIRTLEPVRRNKQGRADRLWFQFDTLGLKDAVILKALLPAFYDGSLLFANGNAL